MFDQPPILSPIGAPVRVLTEATLVRVIHRGGPPVHDLYDSVEYHVEPGEWRLPLGVARHLQARAVVPGSRNPWTGKQQSLLGIIDTEWGQPIDPPARCEPFTAEEIARFGLAVEAIDRAVLLGEAAVVQPIAVADVRRRMLNRGVNLDAQVDAPPAADTLRPARAEDNDALRDLHEDAAGVQQTRRRR
jgi:hypothetical protein